MRIMWPSASVLLAVFDGKQPEHVYTRTLNALQRAGMLTWKSEDGGAVALTEAGRAWCVEFRRVEKESAAVVGKEGGSTNAHTES